MMCMRELRRLVGRRLYYLISVVLIIEMNVMMSLIRDFMFDFGLFTYSITYYMG